MKQLVVDTSILIEFLRVKQKRTTYQYILEKNFLPVVSFITVAELWAGKSVWEDAKIKENLEKLFSGMKIVYPNFKVLVRAGELRAKYNISLLDAFIAALALEENLPLVTLNKKDFLRIKDLNVV